MKKYLSSGGNKQLLNFRIHVLFFYTDSLGERHKITFELHTYPSVMELLWDRGYEDWGDCRGRAWCGTCHIKTSDVVPENKLDKDEQICLSQLYNRTAHSRLSCQILLNKAVCKMEFEFVGDE